MNEGTARVKSSCPRQHQPTGSAREAVGCLQSPSHLPGHLGCASLPFWAHLLASELTTATLHLTSYDYSEFCNSCPDQVNLFNCVSAFLAVLASKTQRMVQRRQLHSLTSSATSWGRQLMVPDIRKTRKSNKPSSSGFLSSTLTPGFPWLWEWDVSRNSEVRRLAVFPCQGYTPRSKLPAGVIPVSLSTRTQKKALSTLYEVCILCLSSASAPSASVTLGKINWPF